MTISHGQTYRFIRPNLLSVTVGFDWIDGSYDDNNKLKPKNPQTHPYFDRLFERRAIHESSDESAKITDSGEKDYNV